MHTAKLAAPLLVLLAWVVGAAPARAETVNCTPILALPAVITEQGVYCFTGDLATAITSGNAIDIQTNNVVLDLNGFKLGGLGAGLGTVANGIFAFNRQNLTIKNGTVRGFMSGIALFGTGQGHVVEDIRADHNTIRGIVVEGTGNLIRNNQVIATGGGTCCGTGTAAVGIRAAGTGPRVLNNDVIDTTSPGDVASRGIQFPALVTGGLAVNNRITNADIPIEYDLSSNGKYRDNLTFGTGGFEGGTDAGNNN